MFTSSEFDGIVALELGAGTGTALIFMLFFPNVSFKPTTKILDDPYDMSIPSKFC